MVFYHVKESHNQLAVLYGDDTVHIFLYVREQLFAGTLHCRTVRNGVHLGKSHHLSLLKGCLHTVGACGLHANDLNFRIQKLGQSGNAGTETASADGNQDIVHGGKLLDNFHCNGALPRSHVQIVKGMYKGISELVRQLICMIAGLVKHIPLQHHVGAVALGAVHLHKRRGGGHDHCGLHTGQLGRVGHTLGMVAGRRCNQTLGLFLLGQGVYLIVGAPHLIGSRVLHVLRLEKYLVSCPGREILTVYQFCLCGHILHKLGGLLKFFQCQFFHIFVLLSLAFILYYSTSMYCFNPRSVISAHGTGH